jgi:uncharacterized membrane protein YcaP (DUF421 family)
LDDFFFQSPSGLLRVFASAVLTYVFVVILVRVTGKRSTSQLNNFDWIVTVAIGSIIGATIVTDSLPLLEGLTGIATLFAVQFVVTWLSTRSRSFSRAVRASPTMLLYRGEFIEEAMLKERVTKEEVLSAIRESGLHELSDADAVVLESDANFSVLSSVDDDRMDRATAMQDVSNLRAEDTGGGADGSASFPP